MTKRQILIPADCSDVISFAADELQRYLGKIEEGPIQISAYNGDLEDTLTDSYILSCTDCCDEDGFSIIPSGTNVKLTGRNERSVLFAVYAFLEQFAGFRWPHVADDVVPVESLINVVTEQIDFTPDFHDRGLNLETGFTQNDMVDFIDWMAKNRMNNVAIPFSRWDEFKEAVCPEIQKRGLKLALSGHSYFRFLPGDQYFEEHPEWYALIDGERRPKGQLCFSNQEGIQTLYRNVLAYLKQQPPVARLSIWPADNKNLCQCEGCAQISFLENYCRFTSNLKQFLTDNNYDTEVDHLAYNAALSDAMLKPLANVDAHSDIDTQLAFWGRDYSYSLDKSPVETDQQAKEFIKDWAALRQPGSQGLYMLEYYTDYWMLTSLFPTLTQVIADDMRFYKQIDVRGMYSLCVGCNYGPFKGKGYPWQWRQGLNMYVFARCCWDSNLDLTLLRQNYFQDYYGDYADDAGSIFKLLEDKLPLLTSFNIPLFRLRFPDIWQRDETPEEGGVSFVPADWQPEQTPTDEERKRNEICHELAALFATQAFSDASDSSTVYASRYANAMAYFQFCCDKLDALSKQLKAQQAIREGNNQEAIQLLEAAMEMQERLYNENSENCKKWITKLTK